MAHDLGRPTLYVKGQNDAADGPLATCTDDEVEALLALCRQAKAELANAEGRPSATDGLEESDGGDTMELKAPSDPE